MRSSYQYQGGSLITNFVKFVLHLPEPELSVVRITSSLSLLQVISFTIRALDNQRQLLSTNLSGEQSWA
jgi:hypothetical protein